MQPLLTQFCQPLPFSLLGHCDTHGPTQTLPSPEESLGPSQERSHEQGEMVANRTDQRALWEYHLYLPLNSFGSGVNVPKDSVCEDYQP